MKYLIALSLLLVAVAATADPAVDKVVACVHANLPKKARLQQVELVSTERNGDTRTLKGRLFVTSDSTSAGERLRLTLKLEQPPDLAGAAYLLRQSDDYLRDGMYVYLPSVRRVRRVSGTFADGALLGSNFTYNDFKQVQTAFVDARSKLEGSERIDGRDTKVLTFTPSGTEGPSRYSQIRTWIDDKTCVPLKTVFFDGANPARELTAPAARLVQSGATWYPAEVQIRDLASGGSSVLRVNGTVDAQAPAPTFDPTTFYLAH